MQSVSLSNLPSDGVADWIEFVALSNGSKPTNIQMLQELGKNNFEISEDAVSFSFSKVVARSKNLGAAYPFQVDSNYLVSKTHFRELSYSHLITMTPSPLLRAAECWQTNLVAKNFEFVVEDCVGEFFGSNTKSLNFGFPSAIGRPPDFPSAIDWLSKMTGIRPGSAYRPPRKKDGGVDIIAWKNFNDDFGGVPFLLVQATILDEFINKIGDVDIRLWAGWLSLDNDPLVALAVPSIVNDKNIWSEINTRGILLDRQRLVKLKSITALGFTDLSQALIDEFRHGVL